MNIDQIKMSLIRSSNGEATAEDKQIVASLTEDQFSDLCRELYPDFYIDDAYSSRSSVDLDIPSNVEDYFSDSGEESMYLGNDNDYQLDYDTPEDFFSHLDEVYTDGMDDNEEYEAFNLYCDLFQLDPNNKDTYDMYSEGRYSIFTKKGRAKRKQQYKENFLHRELNDALYKKRMNERSLPGKIATNLLWRNRAYRQRKRKEFYHKQAKKLANTGMSMGTQYLNKKLQEGANEYSDMYYDMPAKYGAPRLPAGDHRLAAEKAELSAVKAGRRYMQDKQGFAQDRLGPALEELDLINKRIKMSRATKLDFDRKGKLEQMIENRLPGVRAGQAASLAEESLLGRNSYPLTTAGVNRLVDKLEPSTPLSRFTGKITSIY